MGKKSTIIFFVCLAVVITTLGYDLIDKSTRSDVHVIVNPPRVEETVSEGSTLESTTKSNNSSTVPSAVPNDGTETETVAFVDEDIFIDINTADAEELMKLKGIGEHLAAEIIVYREENGEFANIEEILKVSGIGEGIFNDICGNIYVTDPYYPVEIMDVPVDVEEYHELTLEEAAPININLADAELLMLLPHVDEEAAYLIIELRERLGGFSNVRELLLVEGLSREEVSEIIEYITID